MQNLDFPHFKPHFRVLFPFLTTFESGEGTLRVHRKAQTELTVLRNSTPSPSTKFTLVSCSP